MKTRPSTFKPDYVRQARELYARGFTDRELVRAHADRVAAISARPIPDRAG